MRGSIRPPEGRSGRIPVRRGVSSSQFALFSALGVLSIGVLVGCVGRGAFASDGSRAAGPIPVGSAPPQTEQVVRGQTPGTQAPRTQMVQRLITDDGKDDGDIAVGTEWNALDLVSQTEVPLTLFPDPIQPAVGMTEPVIDSVDMDRKSDDPPFTPTSAVPEPDLPEPDLLMRPPVPAEPDETTWIDNEWIDNEEFSTRLLTLPDVLVLLRASPRMVALRGEINIALADRVQAGLLPNPNVSYQRFVTVTGDNDAANDPDEIGISQELLLFGQREAAVRTAELEISATQAEVFAEYADLVTEARRLFATLLVREEVVRVLSESLEHFERVERLVQERFVEGDISEYDLERIRVEVATFRSQLMSARAELVEASGELANLLASPGGFPLARGDLEPLDLKFDYASLAASMQGIHPRIQAARNRGVAARSGITLARKERLPVPELEMGWWHAHAPTRNTAGALFVGISMPTLLFDRGQGKIARADAEALQAAYRQQTVTAEAETQLQSAWQVHFRLKHALDMYGQQIRGRLPDLREMAEESYQEGEIQLIELLDAVNVSVEPQLTYLDLLEAVMHAEIDVLSAAGMVEAYLTP